MDDPRVRDDRLVLLGRDALKTDSTIALTNAFLTRAYRSEGLCLRGTLSELRFVEGDIAVTGSQEAVSSAVSMSGFRLSTFLSVGTAQMIWIAANEPMSAFDYNGNGRIDFADVVWLFNNI